MATPQYQVRDRCFIEPYLLHPGSIIETEGPPGPHLVPLNEEARAKFEAWLTEEIPERDDNGKLVKNTDGSQRMYAPREKFRFALPKDGPTEAPAEMTIISGPPKIGVGVENTLAGKHLQRKLGEMRPPPAPFSDVPAVAGDLGEVVIAHAAPRPKVR